MSWKVDIRGLLLHVPADTVKGIWLLLHKALNPQHVPEFCEHVASKNISMCSPAAILNAYPFSPKALIQWALFKQELEYPKQPESKWGSPFFRIMILSGIETEV